MTELKNYPDVNAYLSHTENFLLEREAVNNLILGICYELQKKNNKKTDHLFLSVVHNEKVMATCICCKGSAILAAATYHTGDLKLIFDYLNENKVPLQTLFGETLYVEIFSEMLEEKVPSNRYRLLTLDKLFNYKSAKAEFSLALNSDLELLSDYLVEYENEINALQRRDKKELVAITEDLLKAQKIFVVKVNNDVVCMATYLRETKNFGVIGNVFTPPAHRNRGYAGFCTAKLSEHILKIGFKGCALFADAKNETANQLYEELGYKVTAEFSEVSLIG